jgi:hypothetical protein
MPGARLAVQVSSVMPTERIHILQATMLLRAHPASGLSFSPDAQSAFALANVPNCQNPDNRAKQSVLSRAQLNVHRVIFSPCHAPLQ